MVLECFPGHELPVIVTSHGGPGYPSRAPTEPWSPSSRGLGRRPFKAEARVRIPLGARGRHFGVDAQPHICACGGVRSSSSPCQGEDRGIEARQARWSEGVPATRVRVLPPVLPPLVDARVIRSRADSPATNPKTGGRARLRQVPPSSCGWQTPTDGCDPDSERWDEIKRIFKQIPPEDRGAVRWWLIEGHQFGEDVSRDLREHLARHHSEG